MKYTRWIPLLFVLLVVLFVGVVRADTPIVIVTDGKMDLPSTITTDTGTYLVIPNYTTGKPMAVIQTAKPKDKKD